jgi:hypothetical protein
VQLFLTLAGHRSLWTFHDSTSLASWLAALPWRREGGLAIIRGGGQTTAPLFIEALASAVASADGGVRSYQLIPLELGVENGILEAIAATLGLPNCARPRDFVLNLSELSHERSLVFTAVCSGEIEAPFLAGAMQLLDHLSKQPVPVPLTIFLLAVGPIAGSAPAVFDFRTGSPAEPPLAFSSSSAVARWAAYLHHRVAWECGGDAELATKWCAHAEWEALISRVGNDDGLERLLNCLASEELQSLPRQYCLDWLDFFEQRGRMPGQGAWRPAAGDGARAAPWLARALLLKKPAGALRWRLRRLLTCRPLAAALLARCLELEGELLGRFAGELIAETSRAPERCRVAWQSFIDRTTPALTYPASHPAIPDAPEDTWLFGTLGEVLYHLDAELSYGDRRRYRELLALRNGIAHGHHVGWQQCEILQRMSALS